MEPQGSELNQSEQKVSVETDKALVEFVKSCVKSSEQHKTRYGYTAEKEKFQRLYEGKLYEGDAQNKLYWESKCNYYAYYVDAMANLLTREPIDDYVYRADKKTDDQRATLLTRVLEYIHFQSGEFAQDWGLTTDAGKFGNGFYYVYYDPTADDYQGLPTYRSLDPRFVGMTPGCEDVDDAAWCYTKIPVSTEAIRRAYPTKAKNIQPDPALSVPEQMNMGASINVTDSTTGAQVGYGSEGAKLDTKGKGNQTDLITFYWRDPEQVTLKTPEEVQAWVEFNPGFGIKSEKVSEYLSRKFPITVPKYPHGRKIQIASDQKLEDAPHPEPTFPLVNFSMYPTSREPWAQGIIHVIREMVQNIHLVSSGMAANIDFINRPFWMTDDPGFEDDSDEFQTNPNELKKLSRVGAKMWPANIPNGVKESLEIMAARIAEIERRTGLKEILFGQRGVGNYTGIQTELLQDAAKGSLVPIFRRFNQAKTKLGNKLFWLVQNRMTSERTLTFVNPDDGPEAIRVAINLPNPESAGTIENNVTEGEWKYYVREISGVPFSKTAEAKQKLEAAKVLQPLDPVEAAVKAIDAIDLPGKQKDIVRIRERGEQMMKGKSEAEQAKMRLEISKLQLKQEDLRIRQYEVQKGLQIEEVETGSDVALNEADGRLKAAQTAKTLAEAAVVEPKSASKGEA